MAVVSCEADVEVDRAEILRIHELWNEINRTWKLNGFEQYLTPDYVCFVGQGIVIRGRDAFEDEWETLSMSVEEDWQLEVFDRDVHIRGDAAWLVYEFNLRGIFDGEPFDERGRGTEIYRRDDGRWLMAHSHFSMRQR